MNIAYTIQEHRALSKALECVVDLLLLVQRHKL